MLLDIYKFISDPFQIGVAILFLSLFFINWSLWSKKIFFGRYVYVIRLSYFLIIPILFFGSISFVDFIINDFSLKKVSLLIVSSFLILLVVGFIKKDNFDNEKIIR